MPFKEQIAVQPGHGRIQRASLPAYYRQPLPASPHRQGHTSGTHPEDQPYQSSGIPRGHYPPVEFYSGTHEDIDTHDPGNRFPALQRNYQKAPLDRRSTRDEPVPRSRPHWLLWIGILLFAMIAGWIIFTAFSSFVQTKLDDLTYGYPRTFQIDQDVGHFGHSSHFVALNLNGKIEVLETQPTNPNSQQSTHLYIVTTLSQDENLLPVTLRFQDMNGDGKLDMLVVFGSFQVPLYNTGTSFQMQPPASK